MSLASFSANAQTASDTLEVEALLQRESKLLDLSSRLALMSELLLGRPYLKNGPLGEGANAEYDQDPLYRTDGFDCTTFVETMIALARSYTPDDFLDQLTQIRYQNGNIDFVSRNHFVEIDWIPNNEKAGFFKDITQDSFPILKTALASQTISKKQWYQAMTLNQLVIPSATTGELSERLTKLQSEGKNFADVDSDLRYLKKENMGLIEAFAAPAVLNIVRELKDAKGSPVKMVTHQVLLIEVEGKLRVRQASSKADTMRVIDQSLAEFQQSLMASSNTLGVNVLKILPR